MKTIDVFYEIREGGDLRTGICAPLRIQFVADSGEWDVRGGEADGYTWIGRADNQAQAVLNWLSARLGLEHYERSETLQATPGVGMEKGNG